MIGIILSNANDFAARENWREKTYIGECNFAFTWDYSCEKRVALENQNLIIVIHNAIVWVGAKTGIREGRKTNNAHERSLSSL